MPIAQTDLFSNARDMIPGKATFYGQFIPDASRLEFEERNASGVRPDHQECIVPFLYPASVMAVG